MGAKSGDEFNLKVEADEDGTYEIILVMTKGPDYAIVQFYLDGKKIGEAIDLYSREVKSTGVISLGKHQLSKGEHRLSVKIVGANEQALQKYTNRYKTSRQ